MAQILTQQDRKNRWKRFLEMDPKVCRMRMIGCSENMPERPLLWPEKKQERIDWMIRSYAGQHEQAQWLDDDSIAHIDCLTGTEIFAEAFGCKVHRPDDNMPFALPCVQNAQEAARLRVPALFESSLAILFEIADAVREQVGKDVPLRLPDIQSPMDIAALIWEKEDFYVAMLEDPQAVQDLAHKVRTLLNSFMDEWFRRYGTAYVAHFPAYWMEGGLTLSEDEIGVVNHDMFQTFFLPELEALSKRYGGLGIHCCADARHQWEGFLRVPNLKFLNLIQPAEVIMEAIPFFEHHVAQWHGIMGMAPGDHFMETNFQKAHLVLEANTNTRAQAEAYAERFRRLCDMD